MKTIACSAPYGIGGLGRHLAQLVEDLRSENALAAYYSPEPAPGDDAGVAISSRLTEVALEYTPARFDPGRAAYLGSELFDRNVARRIRSTDGHIGFAGQALRTFGAHRFATRELVSPTAHVGLLRRRYLEAFAKYPIERPWLNRALYGKTLREYDVADEIQVASGYVLDSFLEAGIPASRLQRTTLMLPDRFSPDPASKPADGVFRAVCVGAITVTKGVPYLLDAFAGLDGDAELTLVGGWGTRGMRKYMAAAVARDPRVAVGADDPLPHIRRADVLVHPSMSDGFGYAPMEALGCGVPVIVTEDTGMKEYVQEGFNGYVVRTADADAIAERLRQLREHPLVSVPESDRRRNPA